MQPAKPRGRPMASLTSTTACAEKDQTGALPYAETCSNASDNRHLCTRLYRELTSETSAPSDSKCLIELCTAEITPGAMPPCIISAMTPILFPLNGLLFKESTEGRAAAKSVTGAAELVASWGSCPGTTGAA
jgi:hypothetical protein